MGSGNPTETACLLIPTADGVGGGTGKRTVFWIVAIAASIRLREVLASDEAALVA